MKSKKKKIENVIITSFMGIGNTINLLPLSEYFSKKNKKVYFLIYNKIARHILKENPYIKNIFIIPKEKSIIKNILFSIKLRKIIDPKSTMFVISYPHGPRRAKFISKLYGANKTVSIELGKKVHDVITNLFPFSKSEKYSRPKIFFSKKEKRFKEDYLKINKVSKKDYVVGIHPGCDKGNVKKRLPKEKYVKLIKNLVHENKKIFLFIGPAEIEMKPFFEKKLNQDLNKKVFIISKNNIRNSAVLMKRCNEYVGNDSGVMHISEATGVKKISSFILTDFNIAFRNYPLGNKKNAIFDINKFLKKINLY